MKLSDENYKELTRRAARLQAERGKRISLNEALAFTFKKPGASSLSELAGSWKISEREWREIRKELDKGWHAWKIEL
ncbi:MAG TPA: hypothetical protein VJA40_00955 [archaeon]|nr:hypothetical protein [archaeon]